MKLPLIQPNMAPTSKILRRRKDFQRIKKGPVLVAEGLRFRGCEEMVAPDRQGRAEPFAYPHGNDSRNGRANTGRAAAVPLARPTGARHQWGFRFSVIWPLGVPASLNGSL